MPEETDGRTFTSRLEDLLEPDAEPDPGGRDLIFDSLVSFVEDYVAEIMRLPGDNAPVAWCPSWWDHPEAIVRFSAMWRAMEYLTTDPALGMSVWWTQHVDPHMRLLRDPVLGPFAACHRVGGHVQQSKLRTDPAPQEMFDHPAYSREAAEAADAAERPTADDIRNSERPWLGWIALTMPPPDNGTVG
ncbi:DUF4913 domain-containing protein [Streptomyces flavalbus]|uniref:DUF4913 domain-containing protein n=1 Tax=Streptomyces flavalbus TaxID=2665155 RepID=A0ABW2WA76_9ACTN